jgi:FkbM family methyltransferase
MLITGRPRRWLGRLRNLYRDEFAQVTYSQEGEDMILARLFEYQSDGFYVDVGAHHPRRFSNTFLFYKRGWNGINIEPNPDVAALFRRERPRDTTLSVGVSDTPGELRYHRFNEPALNSFDEALSLSRVNKQMQIVQVASVRVDRLDSLLSGTMPPGQTIDFLTVDVEGLDHRVLLSNDWVRFRPRCVVTEALDTSMDRVTASPMHLLLLGEGYVLFAKTVNTVIYLERSEPLLRA